MNWPEHYRLINDTFIANIAFEKEENGIIRLNRDPRKDNLKADCYVGKVTEVGTRCKLVKANDDVVFVRWMYSQSNLDDERIAVREIDLVVVNNKCVNGHIAVKLYEPFKKSDDLIRLERRERPKNFWGQVIDIDHSFDNKDTEDLKEGDIILFQYMDEYQYRVGTHTMVFKNIPDVVIAKMEPEELEILLPEKEVINAR